MSKKNTTRRPAPSSWTPDQVRQLRKHYGSETDEEVARRLKRPIAAVTRKARELALAKNKHVFQGAMKMPRWTKADLEQLRKLYPTMPAIDVARAMGRSAKSIQAKALKIGIAKNRPRKSAA